MVAFTGNEVTGWRFGGVRPTYPTDGFVYVYVEDGYFISCQQYQYNEWVEVYGAVYDNGDWVSLSGYNLEEYAAVDDSYDESFYDDSTSDDSTSDDSTSDDSTSDDSDDSWFDDLFNFDSLLAAIVSLVNIIMEFVAIIIDGIVGLIDNILLLMTTFTGFASSFSQFLAETFAFIPDEYWSVMILGVTLVIVATVVKIFRG